MYWESLYIKDQIEVLKYYYIKTKDKKTKRLKLYFTLSLMDILDNQIRININYNLLKIILTLTYVEGSVYSYL